ncbi:hypothetical protein DR093_01755 [Mycoplasma flocculare]|nr:hypothetical protein [Mesomycoplasma flocculare]
MKLKKFFYINFYAMELYYKKRKINKNKTIQKIAHLFISYIIFVPIKTTTKKQNQERLLKLTI